MALTSSNVLAQLSTFEYCLSSLQAWFCANSMSMNPDKSKSILFATSQRAQLLPDQISVNTVNKQSRKPQQCGPSSTKCSETRRLRSSVNSDKVSDVDDDTQESHPSCYYCQDVVSNNYTHILCSICCNIYHQQCSGLYSEVLSVLLGIISQSGWLCQKCKLNYVGLQTQLAKVTAELADMRTSVAWLFEEVTSLKNVSTKPNTPVSMQSTFANNSGTASIMNVADVQREVCVPWAR